MVHSPVPEPAAPGVSDRGGTEPALAGGLSEKIPGTGGQGGTGGHPLGRPGAHGQPGGGGEPQCQRGGGTPHEDPGREHPPSLLRSVSGTVQQQDQRGDPPALAAGIQSAPGGADFGHHRYGLDPASEETEGTAALPGRPVLPGETGPGEAGPEGRPGPVDPGNQGSGSGSPFPVRYPDQTVPHVQAAAAEHPPCVFPVPAAAG